MNKFPRLSSQTIMVWTMARVCGILSIVWLFFSITNIYSFSPFLLVWEKIKEKRVFKKFAYLSELAAATTTHLNAHCLNNVKCTFCKKCPISLSNEFTSCLVNEHRIIISTIIQVIAFVSSNVKDLKRVPWFFTSLFLFTFFMQ